MFNWKDVFFPWSQNKLLKQEVETLTAQCACQRSRIEELENFLHKIEDNHFTHKVVRCHAPVVSLTARSIVSQEECVDRAIQDTIEDLCRQAAPYCTPKIEEEAGLFRITASIDVVQKLE